MIKTWLKAALQAGEQEGQEFTLPADPSYRDFDHVIELAYAIPLLRELRVGYQHKNAVKDVVREFLERKTFALPAGIPIRFDEGDGSGDGTIALGNLSRAEVVRRRGGALLGPLHEAIQASLRPPRRTSRSGRRRGSAATRPSSRTSWSSSRSRPSSGSRARTRTSVGVAALVEDARDVVGWVFNHRHGVGYSIPYDWQGHTAHYFPDFVVRAKLGEVFHNFIIEVKGRLDDKDKEKARRGRRWCEILTENDVEPWHFLMLVENDALDRQDITWWESCSTTTIEDLCRAATSDCRSSRSLAERGWWSLTWWSRWSSSATPCPSTTSP